ncbi:hypothetical protein CPLU01_07401 [Colletotrichum plurivorum]|uniref:Uncharacterized protein n=1 Tax=Colletotrichum plurivorum TaxID=2175906 RepID=A0A8H6KFY2_9PEZI|nr:hypothetical protein CPLU01_07401 [Colletotrichum plurivorum]
MATQGSPSPFFDDYRPTPTQYGSEDRAPAGYDESPFEYRGIEGRKKDPANRTLLTERAITSDSVFGTRVSGPASEHATWRPIWLQPAVLGVFVLVFAACTAALPAMYSYSENNDGLVKTRASLVYLWRFGPTAILTIIAIFWARVELQAIRYMPWIALQRAEKAQDAADIYCLDYTSMISPFILYRSLTRKHYLVSIVAVASLILKVLIVLAPGLYSLASESVVEPVQVQVLDAFNTTTPGPGITETSAYYIAKALDSFDMRHPFGVDEDLAYQTFRHRNGTVRGTARSPLSVTVDGYVARMRCLKMRDYSAPPPTPDNMTGNYWTWNVDLRFEGCDTAVPLFTDRVMWVKPTRPGKTIGNWVIRPGIAAQYRCPNLPQQHNQSVYYGALYGPSAANASRPDFLHIAAVLCTSESYVTPVSVVDDGISPNVSVSANQEQRPVAADLWNLMAVSMPDTGGSWSNSSTTGVIHEPVQAMMKFAGDSLGTGGNVSDPGLYTNDMLYDSVMNMSRILAPLIGHFRLREDGDEASQSVVPGTTIAYIDKLVVNQWVSLTMTVLFGTLAIMASFVLLRYAGWTAVWHRDPATILGGMLYFRSNGALADSVARHAAAESDGEISNWSQCKDTPLVLRTWTRGLAAFCAVGIIAGLLATLRISQESQGLATVDEQGYLHLLWTSVPALVMLGVALYVGCCDWAYRSLAPLSRLSTGPRGAKDLDVSMLDTLGLRALYLSLRMRFYTVTLSQLLAIVCSFLTTLVSVVFAVETVPGSDPIQLQQQTWFGSREIGRGLDGLSLSRDNRQALSSLVLRRQDAALTYPRNTYDDLVFPVLGGLDSVPSSQNLSIELVVPAARLHPTCVKLSSPEDYQTSLSSFVEEDTFYQAQINQTFTCPNGTKSQLTSPQSFSAATNRLGTSYLADVLASPGNPRSVNVTCGLKLTSEQAEYSKWRIQTYVWGEFSKDRNAFTHLAMWRCNYTWVEVPTRVSLAYVDGEWALDPERPPRPEPSGSENPKPWTPPLDVPHVNDDFTSRGVGDVYPQVKLSDPLAGDMDEQFKVLVEPYGSIPLSALREPGRDEEVLRGLQHNYAFVAAQLVNIENRYKMDESSRDSGPPAGGLPDLDAVVTDAGRRRLVQNAVITYILVGVLGAVAAANLWALASAAVRRIREWTLPLDVDVRGLAPDDFHSMTAGVALLQGSNALVHVPEHTHLMDTQEIYGRLAGLDFRMGWFRRAADGGRCYTIGVMGDDGFEFVGDRRGGKGDAL